MAEELFITISEPEKSPRRVVLEGVLEIGRECEGELVADNEVSRRHLKLLPSPNGLKVVDLQSSNGTMVNGVRINEPTTLKPGDVIRLGQTTVTVGEPPPPPSRDTATPSSSDSRTTRTAAPLPEPMAATTIGPAIVGPTTVGSPTPAAAPGRPAPPPGRPPAPPKAPPPAPAVVSAADVRPRFTSTVSAMVRRILGWALHEPMPLVRSVLIAAFVLIVLAGALSKFDANTLQLKSAAVIFPVAVLLAASGVSRAAYLAGEVHHGFFDRLLLSTSRRFPVLIGCMIADFLIGAIAAVPLVLLGLALGVHFSTGIGGMAVTVLVAAAWASVYGGFWYSVAVATGNESFGPLEYGVALPLLLLSPSLVPRDAMSGWMSHVVAFNPVTYLVEAVRGLLLGPWSGGSLVKAAIALAVVGLVSLVLGGAAFRSRVRATVASRSSGTTPKTKTPEQSEAEMLRAALEAERQARLRLEERLAGGG